MTDGLTNLSAVDRLDPSLRETPKRDVDNAGEVNKDEFLQLLVTQLQNQDPLDPMKNEQFAVDLAQFSQVEQLIEINEKLDAQQGGSGSEISSMASYLGHNVALLKDSLDVKDGSAESIKFNLGVDTSKLTLELLNSDGSSAGTVDLGATSKGDHMVDLNNLGVASGNYGFRLTALNPAGFDQDIQAKVAGTVSGFVPGPEPKLIVGGKEVAPGDVAEVFVKDI